MVKGYRDRLNQKSAILFKSIMFDDVNYLRPHLAFISDLQMQ